jgi:hypothetical protein
MTQFCPYVSAKVYVGQGFVGTPYRESMEAQGGKQLDKVATKSLVIVSGKVLDLFCQ